MRRVGRLCMRKGSPPAYDDERILRDKSGRRKAGITGTNDDSEVVSNKGYAESGGNIRATKRAFADSYGESGNH